jgi:hypothetical protein
MGAEVLGLLGINKLRLAKGSHRDRNQGVCLMEAVAWFADLPHTDRPVCVDPVLGAFGRVLNDRFTDAERQQLVDLIPQLVGTAGDQNLSRRRAYLLVDRVIRQILPLVYGDRWPEHAKAMRDLAEVKDADSAQAARDVCRAARANANAAAYYAAYDAANAANAAYYAAYDANAANAANAAAYAANDAANAANAAADANAANAANRATYVDLAIQAFKDAIALR